jgi:hypothetical protein
MLDDQQQYDEVLNISGIYLDNLLSGSQRFNLYAMDLFFVEIEYSTTENKIVGLKAFKTGHLLDRYSNLKGML